MSFEPFFFTQDDDSHWYKVPTRIRAEWQAWRNLPEPDLEASDEAWNAYETPPADAERCEHPSNYVVRESEA